MYLIPYYNMPYPCVPPNNVLWTSRAEILSFYMRNHTDPGFYFGGLGEGQDTSYIGMPQGMEGHVLEIGYTGTGKTSGLLIPSLQTWRGPIIATDIKGELSAAYAELWRNGKVTRPWIKFDPHDKSTPSFDPWQMLRGLDDADCQRCISDMARVLLPEIPGDNQPFWIDSARALVEAILLDGYVRGLSFPEALARFVGTTTSELCKELSTRDDIRIKSAIGEVKKLPGKMRAIFDRELRNRIHPLASDDYLMHALRGEREGARCFGWGDLEEYNIFLRVPETCLEAWSPIINLLYMQLFRNLENRPEKHTTEGKNNSDILLCLDEVAQFGKLPFLIHALTTLRCRDAHIVLSVQSFAQLDKIYGEFDRRIIADNCAYQIMLGSNDVETQRYFADLVGTKKVDMTSWSVNYDAYGNYVGCSCNNSPQREYCIQPHDFAYMDHVVVHTREGTMVLAKHKPGKPLFCNSRSPEPLGPELPAPDNAAFRNETEMLTVVERKNCAEGKLAAYEGAQIQKREEQLRISCTKAEN